MSSYPMENSFTKAESLLSLNNQTQNELGHLLEKKLVIDDAGESSNSPSSGGGQMNQLTVNNMTLGGINSDVIGADLLTADETDNELFASFSSCSSRFRLNSISNNNSPVLFMNELNSSKLNSEINLNLSPSSNALYTNNNIATSQSSVVENKSNNKLAKALFLPIEPIKVF